MQFSDEVNWGVFDFVLAGALLFGTVFAFELIVLKTGNRFYRMAGGVALVTAFLLLWLSAGVGIIGVDGDPANLMNLGVLAVGLIGAVIARFRPAGMARAMLATAVAQVVVAVIALAAGWGTGTTWYPWDILGMTGFFTAMWLVSAGLFQKAAQ